MEMKAKFEVVGVLLGVMDRGGTSASGKEWKKRVLRIASSSLGNEGQIFELETEEERPQGKIVMGTTVRATGEIEGGSFPRLQLKRVLVAAESALAGGGQPSM